MRKVIMTIVVVAASVYIAGTSYSWAEKEPPVMVASTMLNDDLMHYDPIRDASRTITSFPYIQTFDAFPDGITPEEIAQEWYNGGDDDGEWTVLSGATPTGETGPDADHTSGTGKYLYTDASDNPGNPYKSAYLLSPWLDLSSLSAPIMTFWYHLYGIDMGELHVDVYASGSWTNDVVPVLSDNYGAQWLNQAVDLSAFSGMVRVRFRGITGSSYWSDMAIDDVSVYDVTYTGLPTNPDPPDDTTGIPIDKDLTWTNGADTETIDLYFADEEMPVTDKDLSVHVLDGVLANTYDPGILDLDTEYFWRVVLHNTSKATTDGPVWSFTTSSQHLLTVTKGLDTHLNDVELSWLPDTLASVFYKQSPNVLEGFHILTQDVTPSTWHPAALIDGNDYYYMVSNDEAPIIQTISDVDTCAQSGVSIVFTGSVGAVRHDLWVDGVEALTSVSSPCVFGPGDTLDHDYVIRAVFGTFNLDSDLVSAADANYSPGAPLLNSVTNLDGCALSGVSVVFSAGSGATSHDLYVDDSLQASGITSPHIYVPGDANSHDYVVRGINGPCWADSNTVAGIDSTSSSGELLSVDEIVGNMRNVCGGTFTQGSPTDESCRKTDETQFNHTLTRNIAVMETEVTRQMWADLRAVQPTLPADPTNTSYGSKMSNPAQNMSWYETVLFANLLSLQNGLTRCYYMDAAFTDPVTSSNYTSGTFYCNFTASGYRLLSEGEWEYAARAGTTTPFSCNETNYTSGNCSLCTAGTHPTLEQYAVYCANDTGTSEPVGSKLSNPWNLSDMHGNVYEWCWDRYGTYPGDTTDYTGPGSGSERVMRGGSWEYYARNCRSAFRNSSTPDERYYALGFRLLRTIVLDPIIHIISDVDECAQNGISLNFSGGDESQQNDLWVDGAEVAVDIISPYLYDPQDRLEHEYVIRSWIDSESFDSAGVSFTDGNATPEPPVLTSVTDLYGCGLSGVSVFFSAGSSVTSYDLYVDGSLQASGITSPHTYVPGDANSHDYVVRGINELCWADSNTVAGIDSTNSSGELLSVDAIVGNMRGVCHGTFTQGSPTDEPCCYSNETQFNHTLTRNIAVMETEVTRQMWADLRAVQPTLPADPTDTLYGSGMSNPTQNMSWYETVLFANLLSLQNGLTRCYYKDAAFTDPVTSSNYTSGTFYCNFTASGYHLLSEGEWEYAARAGTTTPFSCDETNYTSGNCDVCTAGTHPMLEQYAVYCANATGASEPVGSKMSKPWNLSDMHGNVYEWCWDWYNETYPGDTTDYSGPGSGPGRVVRGGDWDSFARHCRSACRVYRTPDIRHSRLGFRLARTIVLDPIIHIISDVEECAQNGISLNFSGGYGSQQNDLWVDGAKVAVDIISPYLYDPQDRLEHEYVIRSWIESESFDSAGVSFTDSNDTPGPPVLTSVTDLNPCDSGVSIVFTASVEASSHDLYVDGSLQASGIISPHTYVPGDANSHDYVVRAINGTCYTNSNTSAGTDVNNTPGAPIISSVTDLYGCVLSGVSVVFSAGSGATSHDLYVDGSLQASGITSPYTYQPGDPSSHDYIIRGIYGLCWADSNTVAGIDFANANSSGELLSVDAIVGNMRSVCQGTFIQGSPTDEPCRIFNETQFIHTLTRNIAVMETEVTRQMWADLQAVQPTLPADPTNTSYGSGMSNPVNMPTWYETILFANLLSLQNGLDRCYYTDVSLTVPVDATNYTTSPIYCDFGTSGYRLLSEGEWEYAARALTTTPFSCNETNYTSENCGECTAGTHPTLEQYAVYCANEMGTSEPVGSKLPNPWNLSDMHGNVWEWCWDWNGTYPTGMTDHTGPISGTQRVLRGGSWEDEAHRSASRYSSSPNSRGYMFGFRLARSVN